MATLTLRKVWINLMETGASVSANSSDRGRSKGIDGAVQKFAGGRQRSISAVGVKGTFAFTLRDVNDETLNTLTLWMGQTVCLRDHRGRKYFGVYYDLAEEERKDLDLYDVSLTLNEVTYQEGV